MSEIVLSAQLDFTRLVNSRLEYLDIKNNEVPTHLKISSAQWNIIKNDEYSKLTATQLILLSQLLQVSSDELMTGRNFEYGNNKQKPLSNATENWFRKISRESPEIVALLNSICESNEDATDLFETMSAYTAMQSARIKVTFISNGEKNFLSWNEPKELVNGIIAEHILGLLDKLRTKNNLIKPKEYTHEQARRLTYRIKKKIERLDNNLKAMTPKRISDNSSKSDTHKK